METATGRANQKARTRRAIVDACRDLARSGAEVTMPQVAKAALVSEATAYRYFPDLVSLLQEALEAVWPGPDEVLAPVAASTDPAERVAFATERLLRHVLAHQGAVRAMISHTIAAPARAGARPGLRFPLIEHALAPFQGPSPEAMTRLKRSLALACGAEALFVLTDLYGLSPDDAIGVAVDTARTLTEAAFARGPVSGGGS
ncbi:hypothetical protein amrb99_72190 [Actinomadura sp. RB99]|uniref:TetR/AcrR family transcriptional regulator n=1 Tax=Actinomadura sp. RB99 TaxID=2691577 RepID=UPI001687EEBE|nr:TetR/AcrR family transcriptional regulator [Actinomadura sp. RB99]MBD2898252.1 hypothetical protein [Actinomadura sp. RB99]